MNKNKLCVYMHINRENNKPFYVGIGSIKRPYDKAGRSDFWRRYTKKHEYYVQVLHTDLTLEQACVKEIEYIRVFGRRDRGLGALVNLCDGGVGTSGAGKPLIQYTMDGTYVKTWATLSEAVEATGIEQGNISRVCSGIRKQAGGYKWRYVGSPLISSTINANENEHGVSE